MPASADLNSLLKRVDIVGARAVSRVVARARAASMRDAVALDLSAADRLLTTYLASLMVMSHEAAVEWTTELRRRRAAWSAGLFDSANKSEKKSLDKLYSAIAGDVSSKAVKSVRDRLMSAVAATASGEKSDVKAAVKDTFKAGRVPQHVVSTVVRTQTSLAFSAASWQQTSDDDEIWGYEYTTAQDERVRESHAMLDGVRYPKNHKFWKTAAPPNGWNCRCGLTPIYVGELEASVVAYRGVLDIDPAFKFNPGEIFADA